MPDIEIDGVCHPVCMYHLFPAVKGIFQPVHATKLWHYIHAVTCANYCLPCNVLDVEGFHISSACCEIQQFAVNLQERAQVEYS